MNYLKFLVIIALAFAVGDAAKAQNCSITTLSGETIALDICGYSPSPSKPNIPVYVESTVTETESNFEPTFEVYSVTREKWNEIYHGQYHRDQWTTLDHDDPLTLGEVRRIMEFPGERVYAQKNTEKWRWTDSEDPRKKIEIIFLDGEMYQGSAIGL